MSTFETPQPDIAWFERAISACQALRVLAQNQTELLQQSEQIFKREARAQSLQERLNLNSSNPGKPPSSDREDKEAWLRV